MTMKRTYLRARKETNVIVAVGNKLRKEAIALYTQGTDRTSACKHLADTRTRPSHKKGNSAEDDCHEAITQKGNTNVSQLPKE